MSLSTSAWSSSVFEVMYSTKSSVYGLAGPPCRLSDVVDEQDPADDRGQAGEQHEARLEAQRAQRDEQEHVEQRRHLEIEGGRLGVFEWNEKISAISSAMSAITDT